MLSFFNAPGWGIILFVLIAICKAFADTLAHHFDTSVFKTLPREFWDPNTSAEKAKIIPGTGYKLDAWHMINTIAIFGIVLFAFNYKPMFLIGVWSKPVEFILYGGIWNAFFDLFYNHILRRK